jgi:hypothetical protein
MNNSYRDNILVPRAFELLQRFSAEQTGWRSWFYRWRYNDEPLRNDAARLVREAVQLGIIKAEP